MKKYSKLMAVLLVVAMLLPGIAQAAPVADQAKVMRVAGDSRVGTSIKVSEVAMKTAKEAVLVGYEGEADALTGGILAKAKDAPLFFVRASEVEAVKARLDKLGVEKVHVLGGTTVFTEKLMNEFNDYAPKRITGDNRYQTAIAVAKAAVGSKADTVFLAKGNETLADALSIGAISAKTNTPLLLTHGKSLTDVTKQALKDMKVKNVEIIGGKEAVSEEIKKELEELGYKVDRTAGDTRQATSVEIAKKFNPNAKEIVIANGFDYADAVTAGYFAAGRDAVVLLTNQNLVHPSVKEFLEDNKLDTTVLGGIKAIAAGTFDKVVEYLDGVVVEMPEDEKPVEELKVESVSAINAKTLEVKFNKAADVKAADFTVNKGTVKTNVASVAISEDKTVATIELTSKLTKGEYTVTVAQEDADALVATVSVDDEKVSKIEVSTDVAPITSSPTPYQAKVGVKVLNQYGEDITKLNHTDVTVTVGGAATTGALDLEGVLTLGLVSTAKEGDSIYLTLVHGKTGVVAQETVKVSRAAAISEITFGEIYNKDGKTLTQDTNVTKDKFYLPINFKDQYGKEVTKLTDITGKVTLTNANPGVVTVSAVKTVKINNKDVNVLEVNSVNLAGSANIIAVSNTTGANATATLAVEGGVKVASISLGSPQELVTAGKDALFPLTIIDTAGNEIKTIKEYNALDAKDSITLNGPAGTKVVEVKDKGLFVEVASGQVNENIAVTVVVTTSTGKVATQTVVPKEAAKATVITGISSKKATSVRAGDTTGVTITNKDLIVEDQFGQVIKDEADLAAITFTIDEDPAGIFTITQPDTDQKSYKIIAVDPIADPNVMSSKLTFKLATGTTAEKDASAYTKSFSVVKDSQFASYEVEDVKTMYAYEGDDTGTPVKAKGKFYVHTDYNKAIVVNAKTSAGEVVKLTEGADFTVTSKPAVDGEVKFAKDATEAKVNVTITINRTGEQLTKELTYSNVAPKVVDFLFTAIATTDATKAKAIDDPIAVTGALSATNLHTSAAKIVTTDQYGLKKFVTAVDTLTIVPSDASKVTITNNGAVNASATSSEATDVTARVKIGDVTKEIKVTLAP